MIRALKIYYPFLIAVLVIFTAILPGCFPTDNSNTLLLSDGGPLTLDPAISGDVSSHLYVMQIFSGLVYLDNDLKIRPDIAESWHKSSDGKTFIFNIRKGVNFHDGRALTAGDIKYSWERACNPLTGSHTAAMYLNDIVGAEEVMAGEATEISGIQIIDDYTLSVTIDAPKAYFLSKLAYPTAFVVDKNNVSAGNPWWQQPNGTGPFKLGKWEAGQQIILDKNADYYRTPARLEKIVFKILAGVSNDLYETGEIDLTEVSRNYIDIATDDRGPFSGQLSIFPELSFEYIGFNVLKAPFNDINIRKAFCHSVNTEKIIKVILKDTVKKASGILPPGMPGHDPGIPDFEYDPEKASRYIEQSRYKTASEIPPVTITISGIGNRIPEQLGAMIADWETNLGIKVSIRQLETQTFIYNLSDEVDEMFMMGWVADYPDPQNFTDNLFKTGHTFNYGNYSNREIDNAMDIAAVEQNDNKRLQMYSKIERQIIDDAAVIPLWNGVNYVLVKPYVKDYKLNGIAMPSLANAYLER